MQQELLKFSGLALVCMALGACGYGMEQRAASGGVGGATAGLLVGGPVGAVVGAAVGGSGGAAVSTANGEPRR